jgi:hypothetical protein
LFSKNDLIGQGDSILWTQVLAIAAVGAIFGMYDDGPFIYQGHGPRRTGVHTDTTTVAELQIDLRQHTLFCVHYTPPQEKSSLLHIAYHKETTFVCD